MSRLFNLTMLTLALGVMALSAWGFSVTGLRIEAHQLFPKLALYSAVLAGAAYFKYRGINSFVASLLIVFWMGLLCDLHVYPMFLAGRRDLPAQDAWLASIDQRLGLEVPTILAWVELHPTLRLFLECAYDSLIPLMGLAILVTGASGRLREAQEYVVSCVLAVAITFPAFACFQAVGPWTHYGYEPSASQREYARVLAELKSADVYTIDLKYANGLITFPSFHSILAITAGLTFWSIRPLRWPALLWSALIVAATLTTGWHYVIDVLAGVAVVILSRLVARALSRVEARRTTPSPTASRVGERSADLVTV